MKVNLRQVNGIWDAGYVLDKHTLWSTCTGHNEFGHPTFETVRTEAGEALYLLKYRQDFSKVEPLASAIFESICPKFSQIGLVIPMPPSKVRARQPVIELARAIGGKVGATVFEDILRKSAGATQLKNLSTKDEKLAALNASFSINDEIEGAGKWNVLLVDDLFDSGASAEAACAALRSYPKLNKIYFAALTWK